MNMSGETLHLNILLNEERPLSVCTIPRLKLMKGYIQDGKSIIRLFRKHLPLSNGGVCIEGYGLQGGAGGPVLHRLCSDKLGGMR